MNEQKKDRGSVRIEPEVLELLRDEQDRLRKTLGRRPSYSTIILRMYQAYSREADPIHERINEILKHDPSARATIETVLFGVESDIARESLKRKARPLRDVG
jgi:hypothetical protein